MNENLIKYLKEVKASLVKHDMTGEDWEARQEILDKLEEVVVYLKRELILKSNIKALVFDMDGLIFDSERVVQRSWNIVGQKLGFGNVGEHIYNTVGMNAMRRKQYFLEKTGPEFPFDEFTEQTRCVFRGIAEKEGIPMKAGAKELILTGKESGYKLAVATSSSRTHATRLLKESGIYDLFDGIVFGDMVTHSKPDPEIYQKACAAIAVLPEESIAFEDAPLGVRAAAAAGLKVVIVPDLVQPSEEIQKLAWRQLKSLEEFIDDVKA